jgi:hypothetical protein
MTSAAAVRTASVLALAVATYCSTLGAPLHCYGGPDLAYVRACVDLEAEHASQEGR